MIDNKTFGECLKGLYLPETRISQIWFCNPTRGEWCADPVEFDAFIAKLEKQKKVVEAAKKLKPLQPSEVKLGGKLCLGFDELCIALEDLEKE